MIPKIFDYAESLQLVHQASMQFYVVFCGKTIYALYWSRKTIYALRLESFCVLNSAIWKVQTFWASERAIDEIRGPIAKNEFSGHNPNFRDKSKGFTSTL